MSESFLGIDLGTSSVKALKTDENGNRSKTRCFYPCAGPDGWLSAVREALRGIDTADIAAVGLSSQVGTYVVNGKDVFAWSDAVGKEELDGLLAEFPQEVFVRETGMPHPQIISYPLPRLMFFKKKYGSALRGVCQPKELLTEFLTGKKVGDCFSYRGLADAQSCTYSGFLLSSVGVDPSVLPPLVRPEDPVGTVSEAVAAETGLRAGIPVYAGMNDFYCSLLGMGIRDCGDVFDITGTSEHFGILESGLRTDTKLVSSPYPGGYVHYGVTGASGKSLYFGESNFGSADFSGPGIVKNSPVFLPYIGGERAPLFDPDASGVFFGIGDRCGKNELAYSVKEGVAFSIVHIARNLGLSGIRSVRVVGGAAADPVLNTVKATHLGCDIEICSESDASALGAAVIAACGSGYFSGRDEAVKKLCGTSGTVRPVPELRGVLEEKFSIYLSLYPLLKQPFGALKEFVK